ncbi:MAG: hypothetical protein LBC43_01620 [Bifidobacteriaceae bacterium]|jgi:hypothetical protein|nr:hypothetical protein [Bifidobacteriaceae bacterium]
MKVKKAAQVEFNQIAQQYQHLMTEQIQHQQVINTQTPLATIDQELDEAHDYIDALYDVPEEETGLSL